MKTAKREARRPAAWAKVLVLITAALILFPGSLPARGLKAPKRHASILLSDGTTLQGTVLLTPGVDFRLVGMNPVEGFRGKFHKVRTFNLDVIKEMSFRPHAERYTRHFKFAKHPRGFGEKIFSGEPYPIREPKCTVLFNSGEELNGILHTTVIYLKEEDPDTGMSVRNRKFFLKSKQKGKPGEMLADLVYVKRIKMLDEGKKIRRSLDVKLLALDPASAGELKAITQDSLTGVKVKADRETGKIEVLSTFGENVFLATRIGDQYVAGWPEEGTKRTGLFESVDKQFQMKQDYYNEKKLLGIMPLAGGHQVLTLVSLRRQVPENACKGYPGLFEVDGNGNLMEYFRLSVWLWNRDPASGTMTLIDRGSFYRVRIDAESDTPPAAVCPDLWPIVKQDGNILVGKEKREVEK